MDSEPSNPEAEAGPVPPPAGGPEPGSGPSAADEALAPSATPEPAAAATPESGYELIRPIGRGAYGEVYLARDAAGSYVAVKVIFRESFERDRPFEREFEGIRRFMTVSKSYDNQVQIFHLGQREEPRQFYYIMELADDEDTGQTIEPETYAPKTLRSELKRKGHLPVKDCLSIGVALTRALESLHENGLVHRDVKPANIIFVKERPKLADIGLVTDTALSISCVGTEGFIAPEGPGSPQADLYSLGKVLYEMSTGRDRLDFPDLPEDFAALPEREGLLELNAVIARACERDPRKRYATAHAMRDDLLLLQHGGSVRARRAARRNLSLAGVGALILLLSAGLVFGLYRLARPGPSSNRESGVHALQVPEKLAPSANESQLNTLTDAEKAAGWKLLFNGKDFTGWHNFKREGVRPGWQTQAGTLVASDPHDAGDLVTAEQYDWFELELDYNISPAGNSGIMYHVTEEGNNAWATGPEFQLEDNEAATDRERCGWLYALYRPAQDPNTGKPLDATKPAGQWNHVRLLVSPEKCEHEVNGVKYLEYVLGSEDFASRVAKSKFSKLPGFAKSTTGSIALQGDHGQVSFRNIKLRTLAVKPTVTAAAAETGLNTLTPQEKAAGWRLLFDGQTLTGWRNYQQNKPGPEWQVSDGAIVLQRSSRAGDAGKLRAGLMTEEQFGDFSLALEWRISAGANSGVFYRLSESGQQPFETGIEMQVLDNQTHPDAKRGPTHQAGACYDLYGPAKDVTRPIGEWNQARILVRANHVEHWLNGQKLLTYELGSDDWQRRVSQSKFKAYPGYGRSPQGHLLLQDHSGHVEFRNIKIRRLDGGQ